jgi:hypothetical protein
MQNKIDNNEALYQFLFEMDDLLILYKKLNSLIKYDQNNIKVIAEKFEE